MELACVILLPSPDWNNVVPREGFQALGSKPSSQPPLLHPNAPYFVTTWSQHPVRSCACHHTCETPPTIAESVAASAPPSNPRSPPNQLPLMRLTGRMV